MFETKEDLMRCDEKRVECRENRHDRIYEKEANTVNTIVVE